MVAPAADALREMADSIYMTREARSSVLVFAPSTLTFSENGSDWSCARGAMYTPSPCRWAGRPGCGAAPPCSDTFGHAAAWLRYLTDTLFPLVRSRLGVADGKAAIVGFSFGGLVSCFAAWSRPDAFDAAGCDSPSFWWPVQQWPRNETWFEAVLMATTPPPRAARLWVSDGTAEPPVMANTRVAPGSIPFTVARMRAAGLLSFPFEQQVGVEHDQEDAWVRNILWRTLQVITPYEHRAAVPRPSSRPGPML
jgi:pimeloyl-ACP methyl ester carboxylesterase